MDKIINLEENFEEKNLQIKNVLDFKTLDQIQEKVFTEYEKNGFLKKWNVETPNLKLNNLSFNLNDESKKILENEQKIKDIAELALVVTECTETIEEIRKVYTEREKLGLECADIIIRVLNFMSRKQLCASYYILKKDEINIKREYLHGKDI